MLYLTRKVGETVIINGDIEVTIVEIKGKSAKLGFAFPHEATILRKEIHDKIMEENIAASQAADINAADLTKIRLNKMVKTETEN